MSSIFDLNDISDIPSDLIQQLNLASDVDTKMLELFKEAEGELNLTQLLVGYYRKYKDKKTRQYMMTTCYRLAGKGFLISGDGKGVYQATEKGLSILSASKNIINEQEVGNECEVDDEDSWLA